MAVLRKHGPARMTVDEFLVWDSGDRSGRLWQLVDGEPEAMAPASQNHGALQQEIGRQIGNHLIEKRPGCRVIANPGIVPHMRSTLNARIPGIGVTRGPRSDAHMMPNPVLLIEVLSPSNETETWRNVWSYTTIPSVQEIYAHYVAKTTASFEDDPPTVAEMTARWQRITARKMPFLVAVRILMTVRWCLGCRMSPGGRQVLWSVYSTYRVWLMVIMVAVPLVGDSSWKQSASQWCCAL